MSIRPLVRDLQIKSETELNEKSDRLEEDLKHILGWLAQQPHLHARTDEQWLLSFLRGCKFSLQRTKEKLDMFYTMRTMVPEFFSARDPLLPEIQELLKLGLFLPLPKTATPVAPRVIFARCAGDPRKVDLVKVLKTVTMVLDILMNEDDNFVIAGALFLVDSAGVTMSHVIQVTPSICRKSIACLQHAYPARPKGLHFINTPSFFEIVFNMVKPLTTEKIRNRYHVYNEDNLDNVYKNIPRSVLPKEYGGESGTIDELTAYWKKKVENYRDWFLEDTKYYSNETMRLRTSYTFDEILGIEGTFRKLEID